ncbi:DNA-binding transcriptional regulator, AcrR family [Spirosomataceae bacterium TFI 002]|nr:DNA-binding transcriptional regulator, AcrR family [Spirosomataceae bacterium TFI 002]
MRPQKILDKDLLAALSKVFRAKGYEGASLADLAEEVGLQKASLYHRFPQGKKEMADAVLAHIGQWVEVNIFAVLRDATLSPNVRLKAALSHVRALYDGGNESCSFRAFSMESGLSLFEESINNGMNEWISAFTSLGISTNLTPEKAKEYALQTLIDIQGSLIVAKGMSDLQVFENTLQNIESRYSRA